MIQDPELETAVLRFVETFSLVFDNDWDMTKNVIGDELNIHPNGTFINPRVPDEYNNWANRGSLLDAYRSLISLLRQRNVPLPEHVGY